MVFGPGDGGHVAEHNSLRSAVTSQGVALAQSDASTAGRVSNPGTLTGSALLSHLVTGVRPELYGAVGNGTTNDTAAFAALLADGHKVVDLGPKPYLINPDVLDIPEGGLLRGVGSSNVAQGSAPTAYSRILVTNNVGTPGTWGVRVGARGGISNVAILPESGMPGYQVADFPAGTGIAATGLLLNGSGIVATDVFVQGFSSVGVSAGNTSRLTRVFVRSCPRGFDLTGNDGIMNGCVAMFCMEYGIYTDGAFWRFASNRIEWNARYGMRSAGHATIVGNLFDRNGWAGLYLPSASWGQIVSANHFHRNGAGGDGTNGRWGASVPGHTSYVATAEAESAHIKIDYQRAVVLSGNRYSTGKDDAAQGMQSPAHIYTSSTTSTGSNVVAIGNTGERGSADVLGYVAAAYSNLGTICGGTDTTMISHLGRPFSPLYGVDTVAEIKAPGFGPTRAQSVNSSGSYTIPVLAHRSGMVIISGRSSAASALTVVYWSQDSNAGNLTAFHENKIGTMVSAVAISNVGANDEIVITASGTRTYNYAIHYSSQATP